MGPYSWAREWAPPLAVPAVRSLSRVTLALAFPAITGETRRQDHTAAELDFLLAIIDSWDGDDTQFGPDFFNVTVDGTSIFSNTFSFFGAQGYVPPPGVRLTPLPYGPLAGSTGQNFLDADSAYNMGLDPTFSFAHTGSTLTIQWFASSVGGSGQGWQGGADESWAIENLSVTVNAQPIPEPASLALFESGALGMIAAARRRRLRK